MSRSTIFFAASIVFTFGLLPLPKSVAQFGSLELEGMLDSVTGVMSGEIYRGADSDPTPFSLGFNNTAIGDGDLFSLPLTDFFRNNRSIRANWIYDGSTGVDSGSFVDGGNLAVEFSERGTNVASVGPVEGGSFTVFNGGGPRGFGTVRTDFNFESPTSLSPDASPDVSSYLNNGEFLTDNNDFFGIEPPVLKVSPELHFQNATVGTFTNGLDRLVAGLSSQLSPTFGPTDTDGFIDLSFAGSDIFYPFDIVDPSIPSNGELIDDFFDPQVVGTLDVLELQINATYRVNSSELIVDAEKVIANFREDGRLPLAEVPGIFELPDSATSLNEPMRVEVGESSFGRATDWVFDNFDLSNKIVFDPDVAVGYEYELQNPEAGQSFATFLAPQIGGDDEYLISIFDLDSGEFGDAFLLSANTEFNFSQFDSDVTRFIIMGIDEPLDPKDQTAFPALISFNGDGLGSLRQSALVSASAIPEPSSGVGWIVALLALAVRRNRRGEPKGG